VDQRGEGAVVAVLERRRAPDHVVGRNAVVGLGDSADEVAPAGRDDVARESVRVEVAEQVEHGLIDTTDVGASELGVLGGGQERLRRPFEILDGRVRISGEEATGHLEKFAVVASIVLGNDAAQPGVVSFDDGLPGLAGAERWIAGRHLADAAKQEIGLDRQRLFAPERAVVVEHRHAIDGGNVVAAPAPGHPLDEVDDGPLGRTVIPRRELIWRHRWSSRRSSCIGTPHRQSRGVRSQPAAYALRTSGRR
jgi:hypothetical protein